MDNLVQLSDYIENKYGNIYTPSGKGINQVGGMNVKKFSKQILGNRVLDLYLKYAALKTLNSASLVPVAFILGKEYLEKIFTTQTGGGSPIPSNIPLLDHPLVGMYLKLIGLSAINLTTGTLVPLGVLMIIHDLYSHDGQSGGSRTPMGSSIPSNIVQNIDSLVRGQGMVDNILHIPTRFPEVSGNLQLACASGACAPNTYTSYYNVNSTSNMPVQGFPDYKIANSVSNTSWSGDLGTHAQSGVVASMAGGGNSALDVITNPNNGRPALLNSREGKQVLKNYLKLFK
jgi:hypothetical protein|tara:strand:- start:413 stop:1273 length:861 start_codon:yes stop_codon:yes gene_type:complete